MLTISDLLLAAKRGSGIPSNYRLARVLDLTDSAVQRWSTGRGVPDDAQAIRMANMAGLDAGYVVASVRALREKDPVVRAIWADMADRLLLTSGMPKKHDDSGPSSEGGDDDSGSGDGHDDNAPPHRLASAPGMCVMSTFRRKDKALRG